MTSHYGPSMGNSDYIHPGGCAPPSLTRHGCGQQRPLVSSACRSSVGARRCLSGGHPQVGIPRRAPIAHGMPIGTARPHTRKRTTGGRWFSKIGTRRRQEDHVVPRCIDGQRSAYRWRVDISIQPRPDAERIRGTSHGGLEFKDRPVLWHKRQG